MFWGLIMEPNKRYTQTVEKAFHLSMASLDASTASGGLVQVMICYDNRNYLLCTLQKGSIWQVPLDLNFEEGTKIAFTCNGDGYVHLTGYLVPEDDGGLEDFDDLEDEDEDEEIPQLVDGKKRKALNSPKEQNNLKKLKRSKSEEEDEDDDDESDSDDENGTFDMEEDDSDDEELDGEEDDDDDEDESDEEEDDDEEEEEEVKPVVISKKQKQKQQKEQQNQSQEKQVKKEKLVNGKDVKGEKEQGKQKKNKEIKSEEQQQPQKKRKIEGGVQVEDLKVGGGAPAKSGKFVSVYYIGRLKNGKKFDQTQQGEGFKFRLGKGEVIKGWDVGIAGMKVGGKRKITIPAHMAYGAKGSPPVIPPNSELTFDVELRAVH